MKGKGLRVVTSRPFACGEVICDFHGRLISRDEGLEIQQNNQTQAGHLFFFTSKNGQDMCLEAHEERCECHPNKTTFGRQMKHSARRANLSPRLHFVEDEPLIVFMATRDIQPGEELRYDYGDNRRSCGSSKQSSFAFTTKHTASSQQGGGNNNTTARIKVTPSFFA
uniref:SET domain-containing protein n=1 Tax=Sinocyclocheilus grahami TaxID=75366 RepID=A0A672KLB0_SINGR